MIKLQTITEKYWQYEMDLARIADSLGASREMLKANLTNFDLEVREAVTEILMKQFQLLKSGNKIRRAAVTEQPVVNLISYRKFKKLC